MRKELLPVQHLVESVDSNRLIKGHSSWMKSAICPPHIQAKILRVIQEGESQRLGSSVTIRVDVRLIAATNKDIETGVQEGWFRQDLYYRLNVFPIYLPPLRKKKEDIPQLVHHFLSRFSKELNKQIDGLGFGCMELFMNYPWPGNIRELENAIKRAIIMCKGKKILPENLPTRIGSAKEAEIHIRRMLNQDLGPLLDQLFQNVIVAVKNNYGLDALSFLEKELIERAIRKTSGNKARAAYLLGINRNTLRNKMKRYDIKRN